MDNNEQMEFFYELFDATMPRLGPGDDLSTEKALRSVLAVMSSREAAFDAAKLRILDIGCGNGVQTIHPAKHTKAVITAVDNHQPYLDELKRRAEAGGLSDKILPYQRDMADLGMEEESFDLIWSEGALNIMGFREGLEACHRLLAPKGLPAVSELTWLRPDPPEECRQFFADVYPAIVDIETNLAAANDCGFEVLGHFTLPDSAWWESYYNPLSERLNSCREKYSSDPEKIGMIEAIQMEIEIYRKYSKYYGYEFFVMQRR